MKKQALHPSVLKFKQFIKEHPKLIQEVRKNKKSWQEIYEEWFLLGEEDPSWVKFKTNEENSEVPESKTDFFSTFLTGLKKVDMTQMQQHISNASSAIATIQNVIQQFQSPSSTNTLQVDSQRQPFSYRKD